MATVIPVQEPIFAFTSAKTFDEYCQSQPGESRRLLQRIFAGVRLDPDTQRYLASYPLWLTAVLIVEDQTPDTAMILPILERIADACPRLALRVLSTEDDFTAVNDLADEELDLEEDLDDIDLPLLLLFDEEWNQQARWGPRPTAAEERLDQWLAAHPVYQTLLDDESIDSIEDSPELETLVDELTHQMRLWYNNDLTDACVQEIRALLVSLESNE